ncbi:conserved protein of unknown function [Limnospira indica PCC 8005]|uniref:Uncharacterized protein n=1 Tax=Limnospira indica PCC 8005 TaxID=376219 RepID=A0A9P1KCB8_9CYAN|nr:conserved protein of unknown function [Limnospira indica PCC 8005]
MSFLYGVYEPVTRDFNRHGYTQIPKISPSELWRGITLVFAPVKFIGVSFTSSSLPLTI